MTYFLIAGQLRIRFSKDNKVLVRLIPKRIETSDGWFVTTVKSNSASYVRRSETQANEGNSKHS